MDNWIIPSSCAAAALVASLAGAQIPSQGPTQSPTQTTPQSSPQSRALGDRTQTAIAITLTGCVMREADYRAQNSQGRGGAAGTGVGTGNEFVLTGAMPAPNAGDRGSVSTPGAGQGGAEGTVAGGARGSTSAEPGASAPRDGATGTSGVTPGAGASDAGATAARGSVYSLTGNREPGFQQYVGQRVEVIGTLENVGSAVPAPGGAAPTATPGQTTGGAPSVSQMSRVNVTSVRALGGTCR